MANLDPEEMIAVNNILLMNIRALTSRWPLAKQVFVKHFGNGCFSCPAFGMETVEFACSMHNTDPILFARECLQAFALEKKEKNIH